MIYAQLSFLHIDHLLVSLSIHYENIPTLSIICPVCSPFIFSFSFKAHLAHKQSCISSSTAPRDVGTVESVKHTSQEKIACNCILFYKDRMGESGALLFCLVNIN